jgi:hypothetical protein
VIDLGEAEQQPHYGDDSDDDSNDSIVGTNGKKGYPDLRCHRHSPGPSLIAISDINHHEPQIAVFPFVDYDSFCGEGMTPEMLQKEGE